MAELTYRPWQEGDDLTLLEIWGDADSAASGQFRAALAPESDSGPWRRTIVAEDQGIYRFHACACTIVMDGSSFGIWLHGVFEQYRNVTHFCRQDAQRVQHLCAEVSEFCRFVE